VCLHGALWITHHGEGRDIVLATGMAHGISKRGGILQAVRASRVVIELPARSGAMRLPRFGLA